MNKKYLQKNSKTILFLAFLFAVFSFAHYSLAAINTYGPGNTIVLGDFVYDDDYVATTSPCTISIYNPSGSSVLSNFPMTALSNGWHYYSTTTLYYQGVWPSAMTCGSVGGGDLANLDKTFTIGYVSASTTDISNNVWNNAATTSIASAVNTNTTNVVNDASSSLGSAVANANSNILSASSSLASLIFSIPAAVWANGTRSLTTFGTLTSDVATAVWANGTRSLTTFGTLTTDVATAVWGAGTKTLTSFGTLASDVWANGTRTLTGVGSSGLALQSDVTGAVTSVNNNTNAVVGSASSSLTTNIGAVTTNVNAHTDSQLASSVTTINNNTNATVLTASTSLAATIPLAVWANTSRSLTTFGTLASDVWANGTRTLTSGGGTLTASDVWTYATRNLTGAGLSSGSLALQSDVTGAVTSVNNNTNAVVGSASSSLGASIISIPANVWAFNSRTLSSLGTLASDVWNATTRTLTSLTLSTQSPWTVSASNSNSIVAGSSYFATVTTVYNGTLTDSANLPTVTLYDPSGNIVVSSVNMTRTGTGTYTYSYTTPGNAPAGTWSSVFYATVESGKTLSSTQYWNLSTTPAQVIINSISNNVVPNISANITITDEGLSGNEYQYEWCVVTSPSNSCGGGDDVFDATAAKYINAGQDFNTTLTANVPNPGNYYFKVVAYFGTDHSVASRSFTAIANTTNNTSGGNNGGGGGSSGGGISGSTHDTFVSIKNNKTVDLNGDSKINSIDFSILLYYWGSNVTPKNSFVDLNKDGKINSIDFSILLYYWDKK